MDLETLEEIAEYITPLPNFILVIRERKGNYDYKCDMWVPRTNLEPTYKAFVASAGIHPHLPGDGLVVDEHCGTEFVLSVDDDDYAITALDYEKEVFGSYES
jgi:hypothetical protein